MEKLTGVPSTSRSSSLHALFSVPVSPCDTSVFWRARRAAMNDRTLSATKTDEDSRVNTWAIVAAGRSAVPSSSAGNLVGERNVPSKPSKGDTVVVQFKGDLNAGLSGTALAHTRQSAAARRLGAGQGTASHSQLLQVR